MHPLRLRVTARAAGRALPVFMLRLRHGDVPVATARGMRFDVRLIEAAMPPMIDLGIPPGLSTAPPGPWRFGHIAG